MVVVQCDMRLRFGPARSQGGRPTCLAFAASDCHGALRPTWTDLSSEYAFFHAQQLAGRPATVGAVLPAMLETLRLKGQPTEAEWPYLESLPSDLSSWVPPKITQLFHRNCDTASSAVDEVIDILNAGNCPLVLLMISDAFYAPDSEGIVRLPIGEAPDPNRRHAVIAVGHGQIDGERAVLVRNSWGEEWGLCGYAWLPDRFLLPGITRVAKLLEDLSVYPTN